MPHLQLAGGARLYYEVAGSGPAIVFAHGLGGNHMSWWQQVPEFSRRHTCVVFAHRGFHPSTGTPIPEEYGGDLLALVDHLRLDRFALVAQSMGGWTAIDFMLAQGGRVSACVLASTTGSIHLEGSVTGPTTYQSPPGVHQAAGERMYVEQPALHHLYTLIDRIGAVADKEALRLELYRRRRWPPEAVRQIPTPIMSVFGDEEPLFPAAAQAALRREFPAWRHELVPRAGHSVYFERPEEFNRLVTDFLTGLAQG